MDLLERIMKDLSYMRLSIIHYFKNGFKSKKLFAYPHYPSRGSTLYKIGNQLGYNVSNKLSGNIEAVVYWEYLTYREEYALMEDIEPNIRVVNLNSRDISKVFVDEVHNRVFGYSTIVNPLEYNGQIVKKNDINAKHDGEILQGPLKEVEDGFIYQKLIDNTHGDNLVMDYRVPIVNKTLDFIYLKYRNQSVRFTNSTQKTDLVGINEVFSDSEIEYIDAFCRKIKLDYGELDILRDKNDGKIYIVDVNNTPQGPPANISKEDSKKALSAIALAFEHFVNPK
jgi:hypothetical protein